jgi:phosphoglycolate phosphatase
MLTDIFLDLDGTLTDPKVGITKSIRYAMNQLGAPLHENFNLDWAIGPSLWDSFGKMGLKNKDIDKAISHYRERYTDVGLFENKVYQGIPEALEILKKNQIKMYLMTAKPHSYAKKITAYFGLSKFLEYEFGSELNGKNTNKADLIRHALNFLNISASQSIMVGDRKYDIIGAKENFVKTIGVSWGYGTKLELEKAKPEHLIKNPDELTTTILSLTT